MGDYITQLQSPTGLPALWVALGAAGIAYRGAIVSFSSAYSFPICRLDFTNDAAQISGAISAIASDLGNVPLLSRYSAMEAIRIAIWSASYNSLPRELPADSHVSPTAPLNFVASNKKVVIMITDQDNNLPYYSQNVFPGQTSTSWNSGTNTLMSGWQMELNATAYSLAAQGAQTYVIVNPNQGHTPYFWGQNPPQQYVWDDGTHFSASETLTNYKAQNYPYNLQGVALWENAVARMFDITQLGSTAYLQTLVTTIVSDLTACTLPPNSTCTNNVCTCAAGRYRTPNTCLPCPSNNLCQTCTNATACASCAPTAFLPQSNSPCVCDTSFYNNGTGCSVCPSVLNCAVSTCTNTQNSACQVCSPGYYVQGPQFCAACPTIPHCAYQTSICTTQYDGVCQQCEAGYYGSGLSSCQVCPPSNLCATCSNPYGCNTCVDYATGGSNATCTCGPGYYSTNGLCRPVGTTGGAYPGDTSPPSGLSAGAAVAVTLVVLAFIGGGIGAGFYYYRKRQKLGASALQFAGDPTSHVRDKYKKLAGSINTPNPFEDEELFETTGYIPPGGLEVEGGKWSDNTAHFNEQRGVTPEQMRAMRAPPPTPGYSGYSTYEPPDPVLTSPEPAPAPEETPSPAPSPAPRAQAAHYDPLGLDGAPNPNPTPRRAPRLAPTARQAPAPAAAAPAPVARTVQRTAVPAPSQVSVNRTSMADPRSYLFGGDRYGTSRAAPAADVYAAQDLSGDAGHAAASSGFAEMARDDADFDHGVNDDPDGLAPAEAVADEAGYVPYEADAPGDAFGLAAYGAAEDTGEHGDGAEETYAEAEVPGGAWAGYEGEAGAEEGAEVGESIYYDPSGAEASMYADAEGGNPFEEGGEGAPGGVVVHENPFED